MSKQDLVSQMTIRRASNGYFLQGYNPIGKDPDPEIFFTFEDTVERLAQHFGETEFAGTIKHSQEMARALTGIVESAIAPKLKAVEVKVNPGIENLVKDSDDCF